ncbi:hypothetical protein P153DRAFT_367259 [Dothidotthia symphoricarpi CBS 119687]|uniref:DUF7907 domain-containing protein n=1 Tax=Dothidotthia symphoricarpi CBS 119687 TaxID=1392245 RepID=A0A6A6AEX6_9PLEO|nr:uncharacterized protein P153DRAFT_367259 [Dothidotthia symphoricarpi CBS 119687]KAF2128961.1 hypothetical protein P153DRAFT_367259 [Dothidotthia symphoricarpi CBS 119687]
MKLYTLVLAGLTALTAAQDQYYDVQSSGFRLILKSANETLNGTALGACHQGAAIEGLCRTDVTLDDPATSYTTFYHNVSSAQNYSSNAFDTDGILSWVLSANNGALLVPSAMSLSENVGTNIAIPIFMPGWDKYDLVAFEETGSMYISVYQNDTVSPPTYYSPTLKLKNWYVCVTSYSYTYETLVFKIGVQGVPQNPSCTKVDVERVWV